MVLIMVLMMVVMMVVMMVIQIMVTVNGGIFSIIFVYFHYDSDNGTNDGGDEGSTDNGDSKMVVYFFMSCP